MGELAQRSVLVVEDEVLIAMELEDVLAGAGYTEVRLAGSVSEALRAVSEAPPDVAVLDVSLNGEPVFPVADALAELAVPYVLLTGHSKAGMPARQSGRPVVVKPYDPRRLIEVLSDVLAGGNPA
jgi:DNA-binding NtrC family response regulator